MIKTLPKLSMLALAFFATYTNAAETEQLDEIQVLGNEEINNPHPQQSLGKTVVSAAAIEKQPAVNDIADILRRQPGVTYNSGSSTGQYGNKRQIDLRGMGPENTLILIDDKPVTSRNSARYGRNNGRNTLGDSRWVPIEEIESVEIIRGTGAARYGNGAIGGVVSIKTKPVTDKLRGSLSYYVNAPENSKFGTTNRATFNISAPLIANLLGFRLYGSWSKTRPDALDANPPIVLVGRSGTPSTTYYAAREGLRSKDIGGRLSWKITPAQVLTLDASYSRQSNMYAGGDSESSSINQSTWEQQSNETNRVYRQAYSLTHEGKWSWGTNKTYLMFDKTVNSRYPVGLGFSAEGSWSDTYFVDSTLKNYRFSNEFEIPFNTGSVDHVLTIGTNFNYSHLNDPDSMRYNFSAPGIVSYSLGTIPWLDNTNRSGKTSATEYGTFLEDVINLNQGTVITPMLRFDYHSISGVNWSPSLNISHDVNSYLTIKGGVSRAYKAPNLYQSAPNYVLANRQNNCPVNGLALADVGSCYTVGNKDLKPETSFNKEIGFELHNKDDYKLGITYYHNDYRDKIEADTNVLATVYNPNKAVAHVTADTRVYKWDNIPRALVEGVEGYLNLPLIADKLLLGSNFTYIRKSINKTTGNPLSLMPKYTISSTLTYKATDNLDFTTTYTQYGKQLSRPNGIRYMDINSTTQDRLGSYAVWGTSLGYKWHDFSIRAGISNIFDKRIYVTNMAASKSNEIGRAYYTTLKYSF